MLCGASRIRCELSASRGRKRVATADYVSPISLAPVPAILVNAGPTGAKPSRLRRGAIAPSRAASSQRRRIPGPQVPTGGSSRVGVEGEGVIGGGTHWEPITAIGQVQGPDLHPWPRSFLAAGILLKRHGL